MLSRFSAVRSKGCLQLLLLHSTCRVGLATPGNSSDTRTGVFVQPEAVPQFAAQTLQTMNSATNGAAQGSGVSDEELKNIGSKALDTLECRDLKKQIELVLTYYRKDARFVDNIMDITGHPGIFLQFGSLIKYFKDVKLERQPPQVHHYEGSGIAKVEIMNHQHYVINPEGGMARYLFPGKVELDVQSVVTIDLKAKQIINHAENWQGKSAPPEFIRKISGTTTCGILRMLGLQKEINAAMPPHELS
ncbi:hypothetical protein WJX74_009168 [Apatococcus lobatus]|uniref:Uncharacterized protein n=2 Tax=Apatococcus TaxID=904362 RepID=A0AAW1SBC0_9CHLO